MIWAYSVFKWAIVGFVKLENTLLNPIVRGSNFVASWQKDI